VARIWLLLSILVSGGLRAQSAPEAAPGDSDLIQAVPERWTFEAGAEGWRGQDCEAKTVTGQAVEGASSLGIRVDFPVPAAVCYEGDLRCDTLDKVRFSVLAPEEAPQRIKLLFYLKDKDGLYYQYLYPDKLKLGHWQTVSVDLSSDSVDLVPEGHLGRWNRLVASHINVMGVKFVSAEKYGGPVYLDNVERVRRAPAEQALKILDFQPGPARVEVFAKYEVSFRLSREFVNPFDPDEVRVDASFRSEASGRVFKVPGFYYQDYARRKEKGQKDLFLLEDATKGISKEILVEKQEALVPVGTPCWRVRFCPVEAGAHSYYLSIVSGRESLKTRARRFTAVPSARRGFVRVCKTDPRYFEYDNGEFYYPIGHNVRSPFDERWWAVVLGLNELPPDRGTFAYDDILRKMQQNGENFVEIWMASWWLAIEWTKEWRGYHGLTNYNLENAWKLDYVLGLANQHDLYVHLVFDNHGKASAWCDPEWDDNPYNSANGGPVDSQSVEDYFDNPDAKNLYRKTLRYIVARWAYEPRILGWELWSELDLTGENYQFLNHPVKAEWHQDIARYLKEIDPYRHLITSHFSTDHSRIDPGVATLPDIDYVVVDAYRDKGSVVPLVLTTYEVAGQYGKPCFVTEFGGSPWATSASEVIPRLKADLHAGLWSTFMTPTAATPLLWWFEFIDHQDQYFRFKPLANFAKGEDRRNKDLQPRRAIVVARQPYLLYLDVLTLKNREMAYAWVYDRRAMEEWPEEGRETTFQDVNIQIPELSPGKYAFEVWDTRAGTVIETGSAETTGAGWAALLTIPLPQFTIDCALKVKKKQ
jgi:hypothetical protein